MIGRLLIRGHLKRQSCGYHQFAYMVVAFAPNGKGDHCLAADVEWFTPDLREAALAGLSRARRELGLSGAAVIGQVYAHAVDSHPQDFESCAFSIAQRHLREPALRTPPLITDPEELLLFWRSEWLATCELVEGGMDELLLPLGYRRDRPQLEPNHHRVGAWTRTRGPTVDQIKVHGSCPFHGAFPLSELGWDLHFAQRSSADPKQTAVSSALSKLANQPDGWPLESPQAARDLLIACSAEIRRRETTTDRESHP